jgi:cytochrome c553
MKKMIIPAVALFLMVLTHVVMAGDADKGREKAELICQQCHGPEGVGGNNPLWPKLKGQRAPYIIKQLKAFKSGERKDPVMNAIVTGLNDADLENLAAYYNSLK